MNARSRLADRQGRAALMLAAALAANGARAAESTPEPAGPAASGEETPHATPYRPSVSTPAALSVPGWIEVEAGGQRAHAADGSRRDSLPVTVKLAFTPDWGVRVSTDSWAHLVDPAGADVSGGGDASIVLKRRFAVNDASAFGLEAGVSLPTARSGLGSGETDYTLNGIYSADLPAQLHVDLNISPTYLRHVEPGTAHTQWLWAAALSRALGDRWGLVVEPSGTRRDGTQSAAQLLGAVSYNVSPALVLDSGFAFSVKNGGKDHSFFAGLTWLAVRLF